MTERNETTDALIRIEERLKNLEEGKLKSIEFELREMKNELREQYVTKSDMALVNERLKNLEERQEKTDGNIGKVVWLVLSLVLTAIIYGVIKVVG